jgi:hypothetical protein
MSQPYGPPGPVTWIILLYFTLLYFHSIIIIIIIIICSFVHLLHLITPSATYTTQRRMIG